jgi:hypothetical protein
MVFHCHDAMTANLIHSGRLTVAKAHHLERALVTGQARQKLDDWMLQMVQENRMGMSEYSMICYYWMCG